MQISIFDMTIHYFSPQLTNLFFLMLLPFIGRSFIYLLFHFHFSYVLTYVLLVNNKNTIIIISIIPQMAFNHLITKRTIFFICVSNCEIRLTHESPGSCNSTHPETPASSSSSIPRSRVLALFFSALFRSLTFLLASRLELK